METTGELAHALLLGRCRLVSKEDDGAGGSILGFRTEPLPLSKRELAVLAAAERGVANKAVALDNALAYSTVSQALNGAIAKLGFANRAEFLKVLSYLRLGISGSGVRLLGDADIRRVVLPAEVLELDPRLTEAERHVVAEVLKGSSNAAIAVGRRTSSRTVANQLATIYRKLGVSSRWELAARAGNAQGSLAHP